MKDYLIVDFDDFSKEHDCRRELERLKDINPKFKVTLFAVPAGMTAEMLFWADTHRSWVELNQHGLTHSSNYECEKWNHREVFLAISMGQSMIDLARNGKGFKAPGWQISDDCYKVLKLMKMWVADQHYNDDRRPKDLSVYHVGENSYHGHTHNCGCNNGIYEDWENIVKKSKKQKVLNLYRRLLNETNIL